MSWHRWIPQLLSVHFTDISSLSFLHWAFVIVSRNTYFENIKESADKVIDYVDPCNDMNCIIKYVSSLRGKYSDVLHQNGKLHYDDYRTIDRCLDG